MPSEKPSLLRIPGPTPIPPSVQRAMFHPMINHRGDETYSLLNKVKQDIKPIFGTEQDIVFITGGGTAAMEASVINTTSFGDEILIISTGTFGLRFVDICHSLGNKIHHIEVDWGKALTPEVVIDFVKKNPNIKAVFVTFCETSTGVLNPIKEIGHYIHRYSDALFIVDGVSCVGGVETKMDEWEIDILITSSQKAMMLPPGLSIIAVSDRAWNHIENSKQKGFYLDLKKYKNSLSSNRAPFTPALSLLLGLEKVLYILKQEGLENVYKRHELVMRMLRKALKSLGIDLLVSDQHASPTVTAFIAKNFNGDDMRAWLKQELGLILAGGLKNFEGEIIRIGHMGYCFPSDMLQIISILEIGLKQFGENINLGEGVASAQKLYIENITTN